MQGSKYRNIRADFNGRTYDSRKEMRRSAELLFLQNVGVIENLEYQVRFVLLDGYVNNKGEKIRPVCYIADFVYMDKERGRMVVEDTKGMRTEVYKIKKKMFEQRYPEYYFLET